MGRREGGKGRGKEGEEGKDHREGGGKRGRRRERDERREREERRERGSNLLPHSHNLAMHPSYTHHPPHSPLRRALSLR